MKDIIVLITALYQVAKINREDIEVIFKFMQELLKTDIIIEENKVIAEIKDNTLFMYKGIEKYNLSIELDKNKELQTLLYYNMENGYTTVIDEYTIQKEQIIFDLTNEKERKDVMLHFGTDKIENTYIIHTFVAISNYIYDNNLEVDYNFIVDFIRKRIKETCGTGVEN